RGSQMQERALRQAADHEAAFQTHVREVAGSTGAGAANELAKLADLRDRGVISEDEFQQAKTKVLTWAGDFHRWGSRARRASARVRLTRGQRTDPHLSVG